MDKSKSRLGMGAWARFAVLLAGVCTAGMSAWGAIEWGTPQNIVGDADVSTNGVMRYGYSWGSLASDFVSVNGQEFVPCGRNQGTKVDIYSAEMTSWDDDYRPPRNWTSNQTATATCSQNYLDMLRRSMFTSGSVNSVVELRNLLPGRHYEVQLWTTCCFLDCVGSDLTLDGVCTLVSSSGGAEATGMGQWVTGTFVCPPSGTQTFSVTGVAGKWTFINALQVRDVTGDAVIQWEDPINVSVDSDVSTEGRLLYAYNMSGAQTVVNGVTFKAMNNPMFPGGSEGVADVVSSMLSITPNAYGSANLSSDYARLVQGGYYRDNDAGTLKLRNLVPGRSYLVQLWVSDARSMGDDRWVTLDGSCTLHFRTKTGNGQCVVGRFHAIAPTQTIAITPTMSGTAYPSSQWNAVQVRELTPWAIEWDPAASVVDETSVSTEGECVWAYCWNSNSTDVVTVNGVPFAHAGRSTLAIGLDGFVTLEGFENVNLFSDFFPDWESAGASTNLHELLRFGVYSQKQRVSLVHLHHLEPGRDYLLQLFAVDTRFTNYRATLVDGRVRMFHTVETARPCGNFVVGRFKATASDLTIPLSPLAVMGSTATGLSAQINAIQLRCVGGFGANDSTAWSSHQVEDGTDVATEGTLRYAYSYAGAKLTVNGVEFTGWTDGRHLGEDVDFSTQFTGRYNGFYGAGPLTADNPYRTLLSNGVYVDNTADAVTVTLKNLTIGHSYLVQVWVNDTRRDSADRYWQPDGGEKIYYRNGYGIGRFDATGGEHSLVMGFMGKHAQLNALQVRDLGPLANVLQVDGGKLTLTENLSTNAVYSAVPLTISGAGSLDVANGIFAPTCTIDAPWGGADFVKPGSGETTLSGSASALERVFAYVGAINLAGTVPQPLELYAQSGATVAVGEGRTVTARTLDGAGTFAGPGMLELANPHECRTEAALGGGLTVRKTGALDWFHHGPLDGATLVCETGTVWIADGAKSGSFGLSGRVNFLDATVDGTLTAVGDLETTDLVFGTGASLALAGTSALHATDDLDLDGVAIAVETARRAPNHVLVSADGELVGTPVFTFAEDGFQAYFNADLNAWCAKHTGFVIYVR